MTTPGPCGCRVFATMVEGLDEPLDYRIERCPTHAAAFDLLAALRQLVLIHDRGALSTELEWDRARAALTNAEGESDASL